MAKRRTDEAAVGEGGERRKSPSGNVRLDPDLVTMVNFIVDVEGGSQQKLLSPLVRAAVTKRYYEVRARFDEQQKGRG